jgi:DNA-binding protein HU-beta
MNKTELVAAVAEDTQITKEKAAAALEAVIKNIQTALVDGEEVRLPGFGTFKSVHRKETTARNPRTGETVPVPACFVPKFSAAKGLKEALND